MRQECDRSKLRIFTDDNHDADEEGYKDTNGEEKFLLLGVQPPGPSHPSAIRSNALICRPKQVSKTLS